MFAAAWAGLFNFYLEVGGASPNAVASSADDGGLVNVAGANEAIQSYPVSLSCL